jgi:hypothetical protein
MSDTAGAGIGAPAAPISVGAVVKRSLGVFFANIVPFGILALVLGLPGLLYNLSTVEETLSGLGPEFSPTQIAALVLSVLLAYVLMGALVYGTIAQLRGSNPGMGEIVMRGFAVVLPVIVIAIIFSLLMTLGLVLFIVPGIIVVVVFAVTVPAYVVERPGIIGSFRRSRELTKGNRWRVLGVFVLVMVLLIGVGFANGFLVGFASVMGSGLTLAFILNYVISALSSAFFSVNAAVLYHDLRIAKEGVSTDQIAAVFD